VAPLAARVLRQRAKTALRAISRRSSGGVRAHRALTAARADAVRAATVIVRRRAFPPRRPQRARFFGVFRLMAPVYQAS
jgi:hypothetical protein